MRFKFYFAIISGMRKEIKILLTVISLLLVGFGQPAWVSFFGLFASALGFALFWRVLLCYESPKARFWLGTFWFAATQLIQLSWLLSHLYLYIVAVYLFLSFATGLQFGLLAWLFDRHKVKQPSHLLFLAAVWTIMEWLRLFLMSGYTWNPVGLMLSGNLYSMQLASVFGIYGLSFWVMMTNLLGLRALLDKSMKWTAIWIAAACLPYLYGAVQIALVERGDSPELFRAVLVQPSFPVEEAMEFPSTDHLVAFVEDEWRQILTITKQHLDKEVDLVVLPEFVVPFGTYTMVYPYEKIRSMFEEIYADKASLPSLRIPYASFREGQWYVNNAFIAQAIAESFKTGVVAGLEDVDQLDNGKYAYWSAGIYFQPKIGPSLSGDRYAKRVLVPMGEYIPLQCCRDLAACYGVTGSFTPGPGGKVWDCNGKKLGMSICYEETFSDLMRENKQLGAQLLVNLTSDAWYPHSRLTKQHLDHSLLRTVENGFPLLRSCNTGITCAYDSLGREVAMLGKDEKDFESISDSLYVEVPLNPFRTLYSLVGDGFIIGFCFLCILYPLARRKKEPF